MLIIYAIEVDNELRTALLTALDIYSTTGMEPCEMFCGFESYEFNPDAARLAVTSDEALTDYRNKYTHATEPEEEQDLIKELTQDIRQQFDHLMKLRQITDYTEQREYYESLKHLTIGDRVKIKRILDLLIEKEKKE